MLITAWCFVFAAKEFNSHFLGIRTLLECIPVNGKREDYHMLTFWYGWMTKLSQIKSTASLVQSYPILGEIPVCLRSSCMKDKKCTKRYPRQLLNDTRTGEGEYPLYRRRNPENGGVNPFTAIRFSDRNKHNILIFMPVHFRQMGSLVCPMCQKYP